MSVTDDWQLIKPTEKWNNMSVKTSAYVTYFSNLFMLHAILFSDGFWWSWLLWKSVPWNTKLRSDGSWRHVVYWLLHSQCHLLTLYVYMFEMSWKDNERCDLTSLFAKFLCKLLAISHFGNCSFWWNACAIYSWWEIGLTEKYYSKL